MSSQNIDVESGSQGGQLLPCYPCVRTPGGTAHVVSDPTLFEVTPGAEKRQWRPAVTPELASSVKGLKRAGSSKGKPGPTKKRRRFLHVRDNVANIFNDSGSDGEEGNNVINNSENDAEVDNLTEDNVLTVRNFTKQLRTKIIAEDEGIKEGTEAEQKESGESLMNENKLDERTDEVNETIVCSVTERGLSEGSERVDARQARIFTAAAPVDVNFSWSEDFSSFAGQKEVYLRVPGPTFTSPDPALVFQEIWDHEFMETVVRETNLYAWQTISQLSDPDTGTGIPSYMDSWTDVTVGELYRYFALLILLSFSYRSKIRENWSTGILGMPQFRKIMSWNRFHLIGKFLHFVSNEDLSTRGHDRKIEKVKPVVDHCNRKFAAMYTPSQHLSLEECLLWKGRLSWKQYIRSKAAHFGLKSFELCESETGYLLQYRLFTSEKVDMHRDAVHEFEDPTPKVVLDLMHGYLDVGHILVLDNWYNQLLLTRYLKTRHTDVLGRLNHRRQGIPPVIKDLNPKNVNRGTSVSTHSGDITLVAWKNVKLVTIMSTYHQSLMVPISGAAQAIQKPMAVEEYKRYMGGVDRKDQKLSMSLMERTRCLKWYLKVFTRLFNNSLLNAFIIYTRNPMHQVCSYREFHFIVAEELLSRYPLEYPGPSRPPDTAQKPCLRLQPGNHFPVFTKHVSGPRNQYKRLRCVVCSVLKQRVEVRTLCELCNVALCFGKCWKEYHTVLNLKDIVQVDGCN